MHIFQFFELGSNFNKFWYNDNIWLLLYNNSNLDVLCKNLSWSKYTLYKTQWRIIQFSIYLTQEVKYHEFCEVFSSDWPLLYWYCCFWCCRIDAINPDFTRVSQHARADDSNFSSRSKTISCEFAAFILSSNKHFYFFYI